MRRVLTVILAALACALVVATGAAASGGAARLQLHKTHIGTILVDGRGVTLYAFTHDRRNTDTCAHISGCTSVWPIYASGSGKPTAGPGVRASLIGTISVGGRRQVTYAGHPLYGYAPDTTPGDTSYVGVSQFGGSWPALNASGGEVR